ncbi:hypothetical protein KQI65_00250 [bacterium]|nr:hypothetical protein [bacterium]
MQKLHKILLIALLFLCAMSIQAQHLPEDIRWETLYEFLDELSAEQIIDLNTSVKPYSKKLIRQKLHEAQQQELRLSARQRAELRFYLRSYMLEEGNNIRQGGDIDLLRNGSRASVSLYPTGIFYADSLFRLDVTPILGLQYFSTENEFFYHRWQGISAYGYIGEHVGIYTSLRDNHESYQITRAEFLNDRYGTPSKGAATGGRDYSEARGGITVGWDWGSVGLVKDYFQWGSGYAGTNIYSGRFPSPGQLRLHLAPVDWFEFNYIHAWLVSEVLDSTRSFNTQEGVYREIFREKYLATNLFTFKPLQQLHVSFGNSIIYSDVGLQAAYFVPFLFYKSVDHTLNGAANKTGQNAQMFLDISSRQIRHLHLYATVFFDELNTRRFTEGEDNNFYSLKTGARLSNWPVKDVILTGEFTHTNPMVYKHNLATTTFETNRYVLGHYLRDNADELYASVIVKPLRGLRLKAEFSKARKGPDVVYVTGRQAIKVPFMESVRYENQTINLEAGYELTHNGRLFASLTLRDITGPDAALYVPAAYLGKTTTISGGFNIGF